MAGGVVHYGKKGAMRIYARNSTGGAQNYLELRFHDGNFSFPLGPPQPMGNLMLDRETFTTDSHYIEPSDREYLTPMPLSFSFKSVDKYALNALHALSNPFGSSAAWTVGNKTWAGLQSTTITRRNGNNVSFIIPLILPTSVRNYLVRTEVRWDAGSTSANNLVFRFSGVHFPRDQVRGQETPLEGVTITANGLIYGDVAHATAFTTGTNTLA